MKRQYYLHCLHTIFFVLAILFQSSILYGQNTQTTIKGKITDNKSGVHVAGAAVELLLLNDSSISKFALSDSNGVYSINNISSEKYILRCSHINYSLYYSEVIQLKASFEKNIDIKLSIKNETLEKVTVHSKRPSIILDGNKMIIKTANIAGSATSNALELLKSMPGVIVDNNESILLNGKADIVVLINDRKRTLTPAQAARLLKTIPASTIKQIEISNGKSAREDASGSGGVINIVTNKPLGDGYNVELFNEIIIDKYISNTHNVSINYRKNKFDLYTTLGYDRSYSYSTNLATALYNKNLPTETRNKDSSNNLSISKAPYLDVSLDYNINKKSIIGIAGSLYFGKTSGNSFLNSAVVGNQNYLTKNSAENSDKENLNSADLIYTYKPDSVGTKLKIDLGYLEGYAIGIPSFSNEYKNNLGQLLFPPVYIKANVPLNGFQYIGQVDFDKPINKKATFQIGLKLTSGSVKNDVYYDTVRNNQFFRDFSRSDKLKYTEKITAGYITYKQKINNKLGLQVGLRFERTFMQNRAFTPDTTTKRGYNDIFPSASINYNGKNLKTSLNLSKSISRPYYGYLNPYVKYINEFTYQIGNSQLKPAYINSINISNAFKDFLVLNMGYYGSKDNIMLYKRQVRDTTLTIIKPENAFNYDAFYFSLTGYFAFLKEKWQGQINFYGFNYKPKIKPEFVTSSLDSKWLGRFVASTSQSYAVTKSLTTEISYYLYGKNKVNQLQIESRSQFNFNVKYTMLSKALTIGIGVSDIFYKMKQEKNQYYDGYSSNSFFVSNTRRVGISFIVNLGKLQKNFSKSTSTKNESSRYKEK